ncbi:MAG: hypothetical protein B6U89_02190 [Desulfurococcales archaeon ex4484_58]|nr:MAG: hypothetical protein B6U89_02190 [Desulfurococcales archaeon ex4484_58]
MKCSFLIKTRYFEETYEYAIRSNSFEYNHYSGEYRVVRQYSSDGFKVVSSPLMDFNSLLEKLERIKSYWGSVGNIYCSEFYNGNARFGEEFIEEKGVELIKSIDKYFREYSIDHEIILIARHTRIEHDMIEYDVSAVDERYIYELYIYTYTHYLGKLLSTGKILVANRIDDLFREVEHVVHESINKLKIQARMQSFNPIHTGRWTTILAGDAACSFYHEIMHLLQADEPVKLPLESEIGGELDIIEDPFYPGPLQRLFDDELYPAWRRVLVESGVVVDYLRTRLTSNGYRPGNGRGLFNIPKPMYYQLIVKQGDWSFDEALKEFKKLVYIEDIIKAELYGNYINIVPETAFIYEKEKWTPVKNIIVKIPVNQLNRSLIGLTHNLNMRYSYEKNLSIYEVAPTTILESRITI